jgi:hypothetical protein
MATYSRAPTPGNRRTPASHATRATSENAGFRTASKSAQSQITSIGTPTNNSGMTVSAFIPTDTRGTRDADRDPGYPWRARRPIPAMKPELPQSMLTWPLA